MIAVIDDESNWCSWVKDELLKLGYDDKSITIFHSGREFLECDRKYDIAFIDVELGDNEPSGLDVCKEYMKLNPSGYGIILTSHTELSRKGYEVRAFRYIDKQELSSCIPEAMNSIDIAMRMRQEVTLPVVGAGNISVSMEQIMYAETDGRNVTVHLTTLNVICRLSINGLYEILRPYGFYMPHKSYIINLDYVDYYDDKRDIVMKNKAKVLLSRTKKNEYALVYTQWKINRGL